LGVFTAHRGPVLCMAMGPNRVVRPICFRVIARASFTGRITLRLSRIAWSGTQVSGGRDGKAIAWDLETCTSIGEMSGHSGHVTSVAWFTNSDMNVFLTGAQDGRVRVWDIRARREIANIPAHTTPAGSGAVGCIESSCTGVEDVIVSAGADKKLAVLDPRAGFDVVTSFDGHKYAVLCLLRSCSVFVVVCWLLLSC
jgi:WD40 repeat protein